MPLQRNINKYSSTFQFASILEFNTQTSTHSKTLIPQKLEAFCPLSSKSLTKIKGIDANHTKDHITNILNNLDEVLHTLTRQGSSVDTRPSTK